MYVSIFNIFKNIINNKNGNLSKYIKINEQSSNKILQ